MVIRRFMLLYVLVLLTIFSPALDAGWYGPHEIVRGKLGKGKWEFGIEHGDTSDMIPFISSVMPDNTIAISDIPNRKYIFVSTDGKYIREAKWKVRREGDKLYYESNVKVLNYIRAYMEDGSVIVGTGDKYYQYSADRELIKTYTTPPPSWGMFQRTVYTGESHTR